jgi:hypothetical protein
MQLEPQGQAEQPSEAVLTLSIEYECSRSRPVRNEAGAASRTPAFKSRRLRKFAVCEFDEHIGMAVLGRTPADEILAAQLVQRRHKCRLPHNPCAVFRDHLVARAVAAKTNPLPHLLGRPA